MAYEAKVVLDSVGPNGARLTTFELSYPRFVHAELMTHRMFCLAADSILEFEMPSGRKTDFRKLHKMTIQDFVHKWVHGAKPHPSRWGTERSFDLKSRLREMRIRQLDEATGEITTSTIDDAFESGSKPVYEVSAGKYRVAGSADHLLKHQKQGWQTGVPLYSGVVTVDGIRFRGVEPTYDLSIAGPFANFLANKVVVHNSRNSASSRAIPTKSLVARIMEDPALPVFWGRNQSGMQAAGELSEVDQVVATEVILNLRDHAVKEAEWLTKFSNDEEGKPTGLHKQVANRYLEPWMFITVIVTATHYQNFFDLRDHAKAQPEIRETAAKAHELYRTSTPTRLANGEWHMPFVTGRDYPELLRAGFSDDDVRWIAVGRCARVSYLTHDGQRDPSMDLTLGKQKMLESGHMSPLEHVAEAMTTDRWRDYAKERANAWIVSGTPVGNLWGWGQLRKTIRDEDVFSRLQESAAP